MRHLDEGALRRLLDEPFAADDDQRHHLATCPRCRVRSDQIAADAHAAARLMAVPVTRANGPAALAAVRRRVAAEGIVPARRPRFATLRGFRSDRKPAVGAAAALALIAALLWTPAASLAQDFIGLFQPTQIQAIETTSAELQSLRGLSKYGTISQRNLPPSTSYSSADAASAASGMTVLTPATGTPGVPVEAPSFSVQPSATESFTFSAAKAQAAAAARHETIPAMPSNVDGSTLHVTIGTAVITEYSATTTSGGSTSGIPGLVVGQMRAPTVTSSGVSVKDLEDYVLSLPEVSPDLANQIRDIGDPTATLPVPIPVDLVNAQSVDVQGVRGVEVGDNTGLGSGVIWEKDGIIYAVGGPLTQSQVLRIANSLH
jgi:hypothetical protein